MEPRLFSVGFKCVKFKASHLWSKLADDIRTIQYFNRFKFKLHNLQFRILRFQQLLSTE